MYSAMWTIKINKSFYFPTSDRQCYIWSCEGLNFMKVPPSSWVTEICQDFRLSSGFLVPIYTELFSSPIYFGLIKWQSNQNKYTMFFFFCFDPVILMSSGLGMLPCSNDQVEGWRDLRWSPLGWWPMGLHIVVSSRLLLLLLRWTQIAFGLSKWLWIVHSGV